MVRRSTRIAAAAVGIAVGLSTLTAMPAFAENKKLSSLSGWSVGARSSTWVDNNRDAASTQVLLSGVSLYVPYTSIWTTNVSSVQLQLLKDVWGVGFTSQGNRTKAPGSRHDWGRVGAGTYRFQYNGSTYAGTFYGYGSRMNINASTANMYW